MSEFSNAQWGTQFANTTVGAVFSGLGTTVTPIEVLEDSLNAYKKAQTTWNNQATAAPYLNSVAGPSNGQVILDANGQPLGQPLNYAVNVVRNYVPAKVAPRTSTTII
jgi:hypothetical protein